MKSTLHLLVFSFFILLTHGCLKVADDDLISESRGGDLPSEFSVELNSDTTEIRVGTTLTCSAIVDQGLRPAYEIVRDGEGSRSPFVILSSTNQYMIDADDIDVGDLITCRATLAHADGETVTETAQVIVVNSDPLFVTDAEITSDDGAVKVGSMLTCS